MTSTARRPKIIVILGPNASGKTALAIAIAKKFNGEIISADSRQVYRGMDIGTGKVTKREMRGIPHHLLDVASPKKTFTVARYQVLGRRAIKKILKKGKLPIIVGGTGFYIDALLYDYALPAIKPDPALRRKLEKESAEALFKKLRRLDPRRAKRIDRHNKRRLVRALEIIIGTGKPVPVLRRKKPSFDVLKLGIKLPQEILKARIRKRLRMRLKKGMVEEVKRLRRGGVSLKRLDNFGLEYRYISRYLQGLLTKKEMIDLIEKESWRYAKRQMTWFRKDKTIRWLKRD